MDELVEVLHLFDVHDSPSAVIVTPAGTIGSVPVQGRLAIEALIRRTLGDAIVPVRPPGGADALHAVPEAEARPPATSISG